MTDWKVTEIDCKPVVLIKGVIASGRMDGFLK